MNSASPGLRCATTRAVETFLKLGNAASRAFFRATNASSKSTASSMSSTLEDDPSQCMKGSASGDHSVTRFRPTTCAKRLSCVS